MSKLNSYKGGVPLTGGLEPKNNGEFPLLEANAVQVDEAGTRLDEELDTVKRDIENTKEDIIKKQDILSFDGKYNSETNKVATEVTVSNKIAAVIAGAPESLDTLKEIADWINAHPESVAALNEQINANREAIAGKTALTVGGVVQETFNADEKVNTADFDTVVENAAAELESIYLELDEHSTRIDETISLIYYNDTWRYDTDGGVNPQMPIMLDLCLSTPKDGDLGITTDGVLFEITKNIVGDGWNAGYLMTLKGKEALSSNFTDKAIPVYNAIDKELKPSAISDHSTEVTPFLDINFGKANEMRKAFFEQSFLLGDHHYGDGFIQDPNGFRMLMPILTQNETMASERGVKEEVEQVEQKFGYYRISEGGHRIIKPNGLYIVFGSKEGLYLNKSNGTNVVSGANQILIMTAPYNGVEGGTVFVAMGMWVGTASITNPVPVTAIQCELDEGSFVSSMYEAYVMEMVKGQ